MRILVHDHSGHPFQAELSRELARRGHTVTHSFATGYVSGKGRLSADGDAEITFEGIGFTKRIDNMKFRRRLVHEVQRGFALAWQARRTRADITLVSNAQIPTLVVFTFLMAIFRKPWVLWHQDVYAIAVKSFAGAKLGRGYKLVAAVFAIAERWCSRRAEAIVVIAPSFVPVHEEWGTADKVVVIPNWAPLDEIVPTDRDNAWAREHGLTEEKTLLYSGTLGLKHNPVLLVDLARRVREAGQPVRLVVVNEGPATGILLAEAEKQGVAIDVLPFQPYERLPEVLGTGDVLLVLLEKEAGAFSVPSKTLSYLCAGRPILGMIPGENLAASLITEAGGCVVPPEGGSLAEAAAWVETVLEDPEMWEKLGRSSRELAEREFALADCATRFEDILVAASAR